MAITWKNYSTGENYDEMITPGGRARSGAGAVRDVLPAPGRDRSRTGA